MDNTSKQQMSNKTKGAITAIVLGIVATGGYVAGTSTTTQSSPNTLVAAPQAIHTVVVDGVQYFPATTPIVTPVGTQGLTSTRTVTKTRTITRTPTLPAFFTATPGLPTAQPGQQISLVYADALVSGWTNQSWDGAYSEQTAIVHSGTKAWAVQPNSGGGTFNLDHPRTPVLNTAAYQYLEFWFYATSLDYNMGVSIKDNDGTLHPSPAATLSDYIVGGRQANVWQLVRVPLADIGAGNIDVSNLWISNGLAGASPQLYVDDIRFVGNEPPSATPTITGTPPTATRTPTSPPTPTAQPTSTTGQLPWLDIVSGRVVRRDTGAPVELRGVSLLRSEWTGGSMVFERVAIPHLHSVWHANLVIHGFATNPVVTNNQAYLAVLDEYQRLCEQNGIYILFNNYYRYENGDQPSDPHDDPDAQAALVALAARYANKSNVLYALQNEPHTDSHRVTWNHMRPLFDQMITAMRAVDPNRHIIYAPGDGYGRDVSPAVTNGEVGHPDPITADGARNIGYKSNAYDHSTEWGYWTPVADAGLAVLIGEFGTGGQMTQADTEELMRITNTGNRHVPWSAWVFDTEGPPTLLQGDRMQFIPSVPYGASVKAKIIEEATRF